MGQLSRRIFFKAFVRRVLPAASGQILQGLTGKPQLHWEWGRGTRKENELNQIPHPAKSYHASGGSARSQLAQLGWRMVQ